MMFTFDKFGATIHEFWVDSISGSSPTVFSTAGAIDRGSIKILTQEFHPQELNHGPYLLLNLHLDSGQVDELIQTLKKLKAEMA
ncbi:hypothetical protein N5C39_22575 [Enterobacter bugandensis]|uniref:Uncharacterized protein n=1 Tax=Enterobacter bugandensis TaxID=881260 RepID=A0AA42PWC9_9ENTR|nr:hypothetical protein [Enterobacter bugandensis]MDH1321160.1 hypothetical protein [Enterobacter bugandensis]